MFFTCKSHRQSLQDGIQRQWSSKKVRFEDRKGDAGALGALYAHYRVDRVRLRALKDPDAISLPRFLPLILAL